MEKIEDEAISSGWHWTYGWTRRSEMDVGYSGYVYEDGDGNLMVFKDKIYKDGVYLQCCKDKESGEPYLRVMERPKVCNWRAYLRTTYVKKQRKVPHWIKKIRRGEGP